MTPAARIAAAAQVLDEIGDGVPAEKALKAWARGARYAGSKDRAALRDLVFDALRCWRSYAAWGGGNSGRALMIGALRARGEAPEALFTGEGHAPFALSEEEAEAGHPPQGNDALDLPDWLVERFRASLGDAAEAVALSLRDRAPVMLRVNLLKADLPGAQAALADEGITAEPDRIAPTALRVTDGARKIAQSACYAEGLVELQDGASQAAVAALPLHSGWKVLDFCAGGGGKSLAMAALAGAEFTAHDAAPRRMNDLVPRAKRAGAYIARAARADLRPPYDLVLADVPCSGSGTWRRDPEGKWRLTPERLDELCAIQAGILDEIAPMARRHIGYMTCSVLAEECQDQIAAFLDRTPGWRFEKHHAWRPCDAGDGFYMALLTRDGGGNSE